MTVDEFIGWLYASDDKEPCDEDIRAHLQALIYTESKRSAAVLRESANSVEVTDMCCSDDTGNLLEALADHLLATSPGKGGA